MKISRKKFLLGALASLSTGPTAVAYMRYVEPDWFDITHKEVALPHLKRPLKLLHLSDFHASDVVPYELRSSGPSI